MIRGKRSKNKLFWLSGKNQQRFHSFLLKQVIRKAFLNQIFMGSEQTAIKVEKSRIEQKIINWLEI